MLTISLLSSPWMTASAHSTGVEGHSWRKLAAAGWVSSPSLFIEPNTG
jgi:hypothetical protein